MTFIYNRTIRFKETDAAGVVYFANTLALCHEAYEESLMASGIQVRQFFGQNAWVIPIVHANVDYFSPAFCGDRHAIHLTPVLHNEHKFEIGYNIYEVGAPERLVSRAHTHHVCINPLNRQRHPLPQPILAWLADWGKQQSCPLDSDPS